MGSRLAEGMLREAVEVADFVCDGESGGDCSGLQDDFGYFEDDVHPVATMAFFFHSGIIVFGVMSYGGVFVPSLP